VNFEESRENLDLLIDKERLTSAERNEATTRLHLIDELIFNCLGWDRRECISEERFDGQYADYTLGKPFKYAIWEAKREGISFRLPLGLSSGVLRLSTVIDTSNPIRSAVGQVLEYCQKRSVAIAVVTNGNQLVAFLASRQDNVPPLEGKALVFTSLEEMQSRFQLFWDNLSHYAAQERSLHKTLQSESVQPPPDKLALRITGYPEFKNRNPFQHNLKTLAELFIEDLANIPVAEEEFLRSCYSASGAFSHYSLIGKNILQSRYSSVHRSELRVDMLHAVSGPKANLSSELNAELLSAGLRRRPVVLLGEVGVGKTTFIRYLLKVEAKKELERAAIFYIDFLKEPTVPQDLGLYIIRRCNAILYDALGIDPSSDAFVRGVYHFELEKFAQSIYGSLKESNPSLYKIKEIEFLEGKVADEVSHLKACIEHLSKAQRRLIVVCLDNIDQRPIEFQEQVFQIGHSLAETWPCNVFISLRPETFYHSRRKGALAAYQPRVFTVSPPRIDDVIVKRLKYALNQLTNTGKLAGSPAWLSINSQSLLKYLKVLLESFEKSYELMESIDNMSGGNVREALRFVIAFVGSGHVDAEKIIERHDADKRRNAADLKFGQSRRSLAPYGYTIPTHEFLRAVIFGDYAQYDPASSPVCNILDISTNDGREHFLLPNVLSFIERSGGAGEGFVAADSIFEFAQQLGFQPEQVHFGLDRAVDKKLLEKSGRYSSDTKVSGYRITTVGAYTVSKLMRWLVYHDAMVVDTPIVDSVVRAATFNVEHIDKRVERARLFRRYLDEQSLKLTPQDLAFDWLSASQDFSNNIDLAERAVRSALQKNKGNRPTRHG